MNKNPALIAGVVIVAIAAAGWIVWSHLSGGTSVGAPGSLYFTTDEGKTLFTDAPSKLAPFDKDGKEAVRAHVYKCADGTQMVAYLERFTAKGKEVTERYRAEQKAKPGVPPTSIGEITALGRSATEIKRPGDKSWINSSTGMNRQFIEALKCQDGEAPALVNP